jgi:hypothetical protein
VADAKNNPDAAATQDGAGKGNDVYVPWNDGTSIFKQFEDGGYQGTISFYDETTGLYTVAWSDGEVETYAGSGAGDEIDQLVADAKNNLNTGPKFEFETVVYKEFEDGWYQGAVTSFEAGVYTVLWSDGAVATYGNDEITQMVADAANIPNGTSGGTAETSSSSNPKYPFDTVVAKEFEDGWYQGEIIWYLDGMYSVNWSDGEIEEYGEDEIAQMVTDADNNSNISSSSNKASASGSTGLSGGGTAFVVICVLVAVAVGVTCSARKHRTGKEEVEDHLSEHNLNETYSDHVDATQPSPDII